MATTPAFGATIGATTVSAAVNSARSSKGQPRKALVIGAGHNGLTCAFYLAKAGYQVRVFEKRYVVGGCAVTEEIDPLNAPGNRVSTASYMASMLRPEVIRDMQLGRHGLKMIAANPAVQVAFEDGSVLPWWQDQQKTHAELSRYNRKDADAFFRLDAELKELAGYLQPFFLEPPPNTDCWKSSAWANACAD